MSVETPADDRYNGLAAFPDMEAFSAAVAAAEVAHDVLRFYACPCFVVTVGGRVVAAGHCWRVCPACPGCGFSVTGDVPPVTGRTLDALLNELNWYGTWTHCDGAARDVVREVR